MKKTFWIAAFVLSSAGVFAARAGADLRAGDDPPPEPISCPLCGGNPQIHVQKTFAICVKASETAAVALGWSSPRSE